MTDPVFERIDKLEARVKRLAEQRDELLAACKDLVERFVKCAVLAGTSKDFVEIAVAKHRALIAKAEGAEARTNGK